MYVQPCVLYHLQRLPASVNNTSGLCRMASKRLDESCPPSNWCGHLSIILVENAQEESRNYGTPNDQNTKRKAFVDGVNPCCCCRTCVVARLPDTGRDSA